MKRLLCVLLVTCFVLVGCGEQSIDISDTSSSSNNSNVSNQDEIKNNEKDLEKFANDCSQKIQTYIESESLDIKYVDYKTHISEESSITLNFQPINGIEFYLSVVPIGNSIGSISFNASKAFETPFTYKEMGQVYDFSKCLINLVSNDTDSVLAQLETIDGVDKNIASFTNNDFKYNLVFFNTYACSFIFNGYAVDYYNDIANDYHANIKKESIDTSLDKILIALENEDSFNEDATYHINGTLKNVKLDEHGNKFTGMLNDDIGNFYNISITYDDSYNDVDFSKHQDFYGIFSTYFNEFNISYME